MMHHQLLSILFGTSVILLVSFVSGTTDTRQLEGYFRLEVLFTHFDNKGGKIYNGKRCDLMTACDPIIYAFIDLVNPSAPYPGHAKSLNDFQKLVSESGKNVMIMNSKLVKDICSPIFLHRQKPVNVRAEARDHDYFTQHDLIDEFDCRFTFVPKPGSLLDSHNGSWSHVHQCQGTNRPDEISLSYRWRAYPIMSADCGQEKAATKNMPNQRALVQYIPA